jgi:hypothetical protein
MIVKVAPLGERVSEVNVVEGSSVAEILAVAEVDVNGRTIAVNNIPADEQFKVTTEGAIITLAQKMKGGKE